MDDVEPELFGECGVGPKPIFKILIGSLPVLPNGGGGLDGASFGAEIVNVEWLFGISNFAFTVFEVVKDEFGVFGEVEVLVEG